MLRLTPLALLRINYRLLCFPLHLIEDVATAQLDDHDPIRLAYERFLVRCDRTAALHLGDTDAAERAQDLRRHILGVQLTIARRRRRIRQQRDADGAARMAQWEARQQHKERLRAAKVVSLFEYIESVPAP
ncbi:hypothetical protein MOO23_39520 (plasmid) [Rhodococcus opacus]|nr:hypothetical protein [Rhodococcus opacus]UNN05146.1 hypothetical protein MOO23_39520 [Rhodococcus opacus]